MFSSNNYVISNHTPTRDTLLLFTSADIITLQLFEFMLPTIHDSHARHDCALCLLTIIPKFSKYYYLLVIIHIGHQRLIMVVFLVFSRRSLLLNKSYATLQWNLT